MLFLREEEVGYRTKSKWLVWSMVVLGGILLAVLSWRAAQATAIPVPTDAKLFRKGSPLHENVGTGPLIPANLSVSKSDSPDPVVVSNTLTYTVVVSNSGSFSSTGVVLTDTLPASVRFGSATSSQGDCAESDGVVACELGMLEAGSGVTVTLAVTPTETGTITNVATVSSEQPQGDPPANNQDTEETTVMSSDIGVGADLAVSKSDSADPVRVGDPLTYTVAVSNSGSISSTGVVLTDTLPASVRFGSATSSQGDCAESDGVVACELGTLEAGSGVTVTLAVTPTETGMITNVATVSSEQPQGDPPANNQDTEETTVMSSGIGAGADLAVSKSDSADPVRPGDPLTYTVAVTNGGDIPSNGVVLTDTLPVDMSSGSVTSTHGTCTEAEGTVTCELDTLQASEGATVTIVVTPTLPGTITNTVEVTSSTPDPNGENNRATESTQVSPFVADLALVQDPSPEVVALNSPLTYTFVITNNGPTLATNVMFTDTLPAHVEYEPEGSSPGCLASDSTVRCDVGVIDSGDSATVQIVMTARIAGRITQTAGVSANEPDPDSSNNVVTRETLISGQYLPLIMNP